jgi:hypothetical protein
MAVQETDELNHTELNGYCMERGLYKLFAQRLPKQVKNCFFAFGNLSKCIVIIESRHSGKTLELCK